MEAPLSELTLGWTENNPDKLLTEWDCIGMEMFIDSANLL